MNKYYKEKYFTLDETCNLCKKRDRSSWSSFCIVCSSATSWEKARTYINRFDVGKIIKRDFMIYTTHVSDSAIDSYIRMLSTIGFLKRVNPGRYRKLNDIPKALTIAKLKDLSGSWKSWFIPIEKICEYIEREKK